MQDGKEASNNLFIPLFSFQTNANSFIRLKVWGRQQHPNLHSCIFESKSSITNESSKSKTLRLSAFSTSNPRLPILGPSALSWVHWTHWPQQCPKRSPMPREVLRLRRGSRALQRLRRFQRQRFGQVPKSSRRFQVWRVLTVLTVLTAVFQNMLSLVDYHD